MTSSFLAVSSVLMVAASLLSSGGNCQDITNGYFPYSEMLDENYQLLWNHNSSHISFEVRVKTNGYVGFGISGSGSMYPSDVIIGWVRDGRAYFADRHAIGYMVPPKDASQDWFLINASEDGDYTTISMVRELVTCDDQDMPITEGVIRVIYSYHPNDPRSERSIPYHGPERRGSKPIQLLNPPKVSGAGKPLPSDAIFVDFRNQNYSVPGKDTMYSCTTWKVPELDGKHHMIKFEPIIQEGHELLVHHMILYFCALPLADDLVHIQYECYEIDHPPLAFKDCQHVFLVWAIGGGPVELPDHVGVPMGTSLDPRFLILETHYDNPAMRADFVDSSGVRLTLTKELRANDAGILELGIQVSEFPIVPPFNRDFLTQGFCQEECIEEAMGDRDEVYMFGNMQHAHLMGRKLRTRLIRNGTELAPLVENNIYDFNFQEYSIFDERALKKGDSMIVECEYDSSDRLGVSWGGLSTRNEMCLSFILYYPRIPLTTCLSRPYYDIPANMTQNQVYALIAMMDWTDSTIQDGFREAILKAPILNTCGGGALSYGLDQQLTATPNVTEKYVPPSLC